MWNLKVSMKKTELGFKDKQPKSPGKFQMFP